MYCLYCDGNGHTYDINTMIPCPHCSSTGYRSTHPGGSDDKDKIKRWEEEHKDDY